MNSAMKKGILISFIITTIVTFIIVAILSLTLIKPGNENNFLELSVNLPFTAGITSFICIIIQFIMAKANEKKGKLAPYGNTSEQLSFIFYPKNSIAFIIENLIVLTIILGALPSGITYIFCHNLVLGFWPYIIVNSLITGLIAAFSSMYSSFFFNSILYEKASEKME